GARHAGEVLHGPEADVKIELLAQSDVEGADAASDGRGQRTLDRHDVFLDDREGLFGQPDVGAINLGRFLAGVDLHPVNLPLAAVSPGDGGVDDVDHHRRNIDARAVPHDVGDDRVVGDVEAKILVDRDLGAAGRDFDMLIHEFS